MKFSGLSNLEKHVLSEQKKLGKHIEYYICAEQKISKEEFLNDYYKFLNNNENVPIDILNSKIETFDIVHVPVLILGITLNTLVSADIGKNRIIRDEVRVWDDYNHKYKTDYKETTVTDWHHEEFVVDFKKHGIFCNSKKFKSLIESALGDTLNDIGKLRFSEFSDMPPNNLNQLPSTDIGQYSEQEWVQKAIEDSRILIQKKIDEKGDLSRNVSYSVMDNINNDNFVVIPILLPIGYITYKYASREYSYIKLLDSHEGTILQATIPEYALPCEKYKASSKQLFKAYFGFWIVLFVGYWFFSTHFGLFSLSSSAYNVCKIMIIIYIVVQIFDLLYVSGLESSSEESYKAMRKQYLQQLFDKHGSKLKELLMTADKKYKEQ